MGAHEILLYNARHRQQGMRMPVKQRAGELRRVYRFEQGSAPHSAETWACIGGEQHGRNRPPVAWGEVP